MQTKKHHLFVITGPSAVGKTSLAKEIFRKYKNFSPSVTYTTRPERKGTTEDKIMYYVSEAKFKKMIKADRFIEWALVYQNYYGTSKNALLRRLAKKNVLINIDVQGALQIIKIFPEATSIFILPDNLQFLASRLTQRGTPLKVKKIRLATAAKEIKQAKKFTYQVKNYNGRFKQTLNKLLKIAQKELKKD